MPSGTTVSFNPTPIPAPGAGSSTMTITVWVEHADGNLPHHSYRQRRRDPAKHHGHVDGDCAGKLHTFGFAGFAKCCTRESGNIDDYDRNQRWIQQRDQSVSIREPFGDDGKLQSQPDTGSGFGQLDHDHYGRIEHADGDLSHHGDRQRWRHPAKHHGHADGDCAGKLHTFGFAGFAKCCTRESGNIDDYDRNQRWFQQRDQSVSIGNAFGDDGKLLTQPDTGPRLGQLDHDDYCRDRARRRGLIPLR